VAPRFILSRPDDTWDARIGVGELGAAATQRFPFRCVVSGVEVVPVDGLLSLSDCLSAFPVGLLTA
jgi:hypothetical protein